MSKQYNIKSSEVLKIIYYFILFFLFSYTYTVASPIQNNLKSQEIISILGGDLYDNSKCYNKTKSSRPDEWHIAIQNMELKLNMKKKFSDVLEKTKTFSEKSHSKNNETSFFQKVPHKKRKIQLYIPYYKCHMNGKYRLTGDLIDHVGGPGDIPHSIKVSLSGESIGNITSFKLFVPRSRSYANEVILSKLFEKLGFLSPRTALTTVHFGEQSFKVVFQEHISKDFLEYNNIQESFLFEGDERFGLARIFTVPKIVNPKLLKTSVGIEISEKIFSELSEVYLKSGMTSNAFNPKLDKTVFTNEPIVNSDYFDNASQREILLFNLLSMASNASGGLSKDDHRFVFDHITRKFRPILYDSHVGLKSFKSFDKLKVPFYFNEKNRTDLLNSIKNLDLNTLSTELFNQGVNIKPAQLEKIIQTIIDNLKNIEPTLTNKKLINTDIYMKKNEVLSEFFTQYRWNGPKLSRNEMTFIFRKSNEKIEKCISVNDTLRCETEEFKISNIIDLSQQLMEDLGPDFDNSIYIPAFNENISDYMSIKNFNSTKLDKTDILTTPGIKIKIDKIKKEILFTSDRTIESVSQIILRNGKLDNWKIEVDQNLKLGYLQQQNDRRSKLGYTGCLTLHDIEINNVSFMVHSAKCEDGIHFIRASGENISVNINNSLSDALDADFSHLNFKKITINNAGNDCLDLSTGKYDINNFKIEKCLDKGISIGESSNVIIHNGHIKNVKIGIAAKDSSKVKLVNTNILESRLCLAAYRKKQQYAGAAIAAYNTECAERKYYNQIGSEIELFK
jgi:hypothetical protein